MKYLGSAGIGLLTVLLVFFFLEPMVQPANTFQLRIRATVEQDDFFQIFFQHDTSEAFTENLSQRQSIRGTTEPQWILFDIPYDRPITKLRMDMGQNEDQDRIQIHRIRLTPSLRKVDTLSIKNDFYRNEGLVPIGKGVYQLQSWNGQFDPQFISTFSLSEYLRPPPGTPGTNTNSSWILWVSMLLGVLAFWRSWHLSWSRWQVPQIAFAFLILVLILVPVAFVTLELEPELDVSENRQLAERPAFFWHTDYTSAYDRYYQDQFGMRSWMVQTAAFLKTRIFSVSPRPEKVQVGRNGYLFFTSKEGKAYGSFSRTNRASDVELEVYFERENYLSNYLNDQGIEYLRTFWPNKHTIYPEYLPISLKSQIRPGPSLVDQARDRLAEGGLRLIDVRSHLLREKEQRQLYRKLDTHWNFHGGYEAYVSFCALTQKELGLTPFPRSSFSILSHLSGKGDLLTIMGVDSLAGYADSIPTYVANADLPTFQNRKEQPGFPAKATITICPEAADDRTVMVYHDSYIGLVKPFLSRHFRKVIYIWDTPIDLDLVDREQPDVVISAPLERFFEALVR